jgi:hypothetical protein
LVRSTIQKSGTAAAAEGIAGSPVASASAASSSVVVEGVEKRGYEGYF